MDPARAWATAKTALQVAVALAITAALTYAVAAALVAWTVPASRYSR
jgi:hypothetical protein